MKYTVQFGFGCYATFSSMEKAALAMRCIAEADCGVQEKPELEDCDDTPTIRMFPAWPKTKVEIPQKTMPIPEVR